MGDGLSKPFDELRHLFRILRPTHEPGHPAFFKQFKRLLLNILQRTARTIDEGGRNRQLGTHLVNSLRRPASSGSPSTVVVVMFCLNLSSWGSRPPTFSLTFLDPCEPLCQSCTAVVHSTNTSKRLMRALTPPRAELRGGNQSADSSATSRRIFASFASLCFFAGRSRAVRGLTPRRVLDPLTSTLIQVTPGGLAFRPIVFSKHVLGGCSCGEVDYLRPSSLATATRPGGR